MPVRLTPSQQKALNLLDALADNLANLLSYIRALENTQTNAGNLQGAIDLDNCASQVTNELMQIQGQSLTIIDDSPQLTTAIQNLGTANAQIKAAIATGQQAQQAITAIAGIVQLAGSAITAVLTV